jgi:cysteine sulfinate desulfinase/cysteine desulfurase-like protein
MDYAATTPVDPRVQEAMMPYFREFFGNPRLYIDLDKKRKLQ